MDGWRHLKGGGGNAQARSVQTDEMNVHVPQTEESYAEAIQLLSVGRNLMAPQRNVPMMGIVYDALSGAYLMTLPQHMLETIPVSISETGEKMKNTAAKLAELQQKMAADPTNADKFKKQIIQLEEQGQVLGRSITRMQQLLESFGRQLELDPIIYNYAISRVMSAPQFDSLYERLEKYNVNPYTGRGLISSTFPEDFDYDANGVVIKEGVMIKGVLDDKIIGRKDGSIIQEMYKQLGQLDVVDFMSDIQFVVNAFLEQRGFSVGIDDCVPTDPDFRVKVDGIMMDARMKVAALSGKMQSKIMEEQRERKIVSILEKAKTQTEKLVQEYFSAENAIMIMSLSGAKGSMLNAIQMAAVLGQQKVSNQRIISGLPGGRSLPIFRRDDPDPRTKGMCYNSFATGLEPDEFFFHSQGGRENLTDTAIQTSQTGFLQHQIIKSAEDIHIGTDTSVRAIDDTIVQFVYGDDSMDAGELGTVKIAGESIPFFRNIQQLASKINREYGAM